MVDRADALPVKAENFEREGCLYDGCDDELGIFILYQMIVRVRTASHGSDDTYFIEEGVRVGSYETIGYDKKQEAIREKAH